MAPETPSLRKFARNLFLATGGEIETAENRGKIHMHAAICANLKARRIPQHCTLFNHFFQPLAPSGALTVLGHWRCSELKALRLLSSVACKVTPRVQFVQETTKESILNLSCRNFGSTSRFWFPHID